MSQWMLLGAWLMGVTGSLHCAGMCGPIVWVMPFQQLEGWRRGLGLGLYHFGRITSYALLGLALYQFRALFAPGLQQWISLMLGVLLLGLGLAHFTPMKWKFQWMLGQRLIQRRFLKELVYPYPERLLLAGMLHGLLPCGLVYMALAAVVSAPTAIGSVLQMYAFGLGTAPMLLAITYLKRFWQGRHVNAVRRWVPFAMLLFGGLLVLRGANLGIPYISPQVSPDAGVAPVAVRCHAPN